MFRKYVPYNTAANVGIDYQTYSSSRITHRKKQSDAGVKSISYKRNLFLYNFRTFYMAYQNGGPIVLSKN